MLFFDDGLRFVGEDSSEFVSDEFLHINNSGHQIIKNEKIMMNRPNGRSDYLLIYVSEGQGEYFLDGSIHNCVAGSLILYRPTKKQVYCYNSENSQQISAYWIHFSGTFIEELLEQCGITSEICHIGVSMELQKIWEKIIRYMQTNIDDYQLMCRGYLLQLFALIKQKNNSCDIHDTDSSISEVEKIIRNSYFNDFSNQELAQLCNMSVSNFIKMFKERYGRSPRNYRLVIQMEYAQRYLQLTSMPIQDIAKHIGFSDALYFSRVFKKYIGKSPAEYRLEDKPFIQ